MFDPQDPLARPADWRGWIVPQDWARFTAEEHGVWDTLYTRQVPYLGTHIVAPFRAGLDLLDLGAGGIPELEGLSDRLEALSGWRLVSVAGIVPDDAFFAMLAAGKFPIGNFIRPADSLDYLEEPDCFHDIFGHVPMIAHPPIGAADGSAGTIGGRGDCGGNGRGDEPAVLAHGRIRAGAARTARPRSWARDWRRVSARRMSRWRRRCRARVSRCTMQCAPPIATTPSSRIYFVSNSLEATAGLLEGLDVAGLRRAISG